MGKELTKDASGERAPAKAWLMGTAGWFFPGAGHLLQGHWGRALLLGGTIWMCFVGGLMMGGHLFKYSGAEQGLSALLQVPPMIANLGTGVLYLVCWVFGLGFSDDPQQAARATYEYGNTFLLIAGLLNYLAMLDAFDISVGEEVLRHFLVMTVFAVFAAVVFGTVAKDTNKDRFLYGLKVFAEFMIIGLALGWILYFLPF